MLEIFHGVPTRRWSNGEQQRGAPRKDSWGSVTYRKAYVFVLLDVEGMPIYVPAKLTAANLIIPELMFFGKRV
jgi:hypothetical protein